MGLVFGLHYATSNQPSNYSKQENKAARFQGQPELIIYLTSRSLAHWLMHSRLLPVTPVSHIYKELHTMEELQWVQNIESILQILS